jgi:hypothetical protein
MMSEECLHGFSADLKEKPDIEGPELVNRLGI